MRPKTRILMRILFNFAMVMICIHIYYEYLKTTTEVTRTVVPVTAVPPETWTRYNETWRGLRLPVMTAMPRGRLGNVLSEYASLLAMAKIYNTSVILDSGMKNILIDAFPDLSIPELLDLKGVKWKDLLNTELFNYTIMQQAAAGLLGPHCFRMRGFPVEYQLFNAYKPAVLKEFRFATKIQRKIDEFLMNETISRFNESEREILVYVGFHIRRTDYTHHMKVLFDGKLPEPSYYLKAINYYRRKYPLVFFIVASDDTKHAKHHLKNIENLVISEGRNNFEDMALLASCNHSIMTLGTYGFWGSFLANGNVVYPDIKQTDDKDNFFNRRMYEHAKLENFIPIPSD